MRNLRSLCRQKNKNKNQAPKKTKVFFYATVKSYSWHFSESPSGHQSTKQQNSNKTAIFWQLIRKKKTHIPLLYQEYISLQINNAIKMLKKLLVEKVQCHYEVTAAWHRLFWQHRRDIQPDRERKKKHNRMRAEVE